jgi:hypothetical protein
VATPPASVVLVGESNDPAVQAQVTSQPVCRTALPYVSASCAVMVTAVPAGGAVLLAETRYLTGAPAIVAMLLLVPIRLLASVPVKLYVTPAFVLVVKALLATPFALVGLVGDAKNPPSPVLDQVTTAPPVATALPYVSVSCAVIVTVAPATKSGLLGVTTYLAGAPAIVTTPPPDPLRALASVAVNAYVTPAVVPVVNVTVATPLALVVLVGDANEPPAPVLDHVTTWPGLLTGAPFASVSCAVTVTGVAAGTDDALAVTTY